MTYLNKQFIAEQEKKLRKEKEKLEEELNFLTRKNKDVKESWNENMDKDNAEEKIDEIEESGNTLPIVYILESDIKKIEESLERIKNGNYGICIKCQEAIAMQRLEVYPQARFCIKCQENINED